MKSQSKHEPSLEERLSRQAQRDREQASKLPPGKEREVLLRSARQADTAADIAEWINSPGLQAPK